MPPHPPATTAKTLHSPARLQLVPAAILEAKAGPGDEFAQGARNEDLARAGEVGDLRADRYRDPGDLAVVQLALAGVKTGAHPEADRLDRIASGGRRLDRPSRPVEGGEEPVAGGVELEAADSAQLTPDEGVVARQRVASGCVAEVGRELGRADDVGAGR
jgi:hypothetical protein